MTNGLLEEHLSCPNENFIRQFAICPIYALAFEKWDIQLELFSPPHAELRIGKVGNGQLWKFNTCLSEKGLEPPERVVGKIWGHGE